MELDELRSNWDRFGSEDPFWAILTVPGREGGGWDPHLDEFFASGCGHVAEVLRTLEQLGVPVARGCALDFGCGVGRVTEALADHFGDVLGIDVAASMVERAREMSRHPDRARYLANAASDLAVVPTASVDLVHSTIVLQHMVPELMAGYLREFLRVLRPGGVAVFQIPAAHQPRTPSSEIPADADRATVEVVAPDGPVVAAPGAPVTVRVRVRNEGTATWTTSDDGDGVVFGPVRVGDHWLATDGSVRQLDDVRGELPGPVPPGGSAEVDVVVAAPTTPGRHHLALDVVREGRHWFSERGSEWAVVAVDVDAAARAPADVAPAPAAGGAPIMEMHAMAETAVVDVVEGAGGRVLALLRDGACGPDWRSWTYVALRS